MHTKDRYVIYKWLGCKFSPSPKGEGLFPYFHREDGTNEESRVLYYTGLVFKDMPNPYLKWNKVSLAIFCIL